MQKLRYKVGKPCHLDLVVIQSWKYKIFRELSSIPFLILVVKNSIGSTKGPLGIYTM